MARGSTAATTAANSANTLSNNYAANAANIFGGLDPELQQFATAPPGMTPADMAKVTTSNMQTAGGTEAGTVGQGGLLAARTRNAGGAANAVASGARTAGKNLSNANLETQIQNQKLKNEQQGEGISGLEGLYGQDLGGSVNALGQVASNVNANTQAINASYDPFTDIVDPLLSAAGSSVKFNVPGCWIAEAIYGVDDLRTHVVRAWLNNDFKRTFPGSLVMWLYLRIGKPVAWLVRRSTLLRTAFKPLFDAALRKALTF